MKFIRINDELYKKLKTHAAADKRPAQAELEIILELYFDEAEGGLTSEQVAKNRLLENQAVKAHIVAEGKRLGKL